MTAALALIAGYLFGSLSGARIMGRGQGGGGLRAGAIDILQAPLPTLAARLIWPDGPEMFLVAAGGLIGHVYPVYHRFAGGFGISPLLGALLVIDRLVPLVAIAAFAILGLVFGSAYPGIETWPVGLVPWFVWQGYVWGVGLAVRANLIYWRSRSESIAAARCWRRDERPWRGRVKDFARYPTMRCRPSERHG